MTTDDRIPTTVRAAPESEQRPLLAQHVRDTEHGRNEQRERQHANEGERQVAIRVGSDVREHIGEVLAGPMRRSESG